MHVLIIGANGKVGKRFAQKISTSSQHQATAFIRKEAQRAFFEELGLGVEVESLESSPEVIENIIKKYDAVVFTAGSGGKTGADKTIEIDLDGAIKVIHAAEKEGVNRLVMVSASHADDRSFWGKVDGMKPYYIAKHYADEALKRSNLDYTILRPVLLTDDEKAGKVLLTYDQDKVGAEIPREAVAETILQVLNNEKTFEKVIEMSSGEDELTDAITKLTQ